MKSEIDYRQLLKLNEDMLDVIDIMIEKRLSDYNKYPRCYYQDGKILTNNGNGTYNILINDNTEILKARQGLTVVVGDIVSVCIINGNTSRKYIIDLRVI